MFWIFLIAAAVIIYIVYYQDSNTNVRTGTNTAPTPIHDSCIMAFLHSYRSLCNKHQINGTNVLLTWQATSDRSTEIKAYTKIFKIDGQDASESVDILRMSIALAKHSIETNNQNLEPVDLYPLKRRATEKLILDYFGADEMSGVFWDIEDCSYVEGKYLEFESAGVILSQNKTSVDSALNSLATKIHEKYPDAQITKTVNCIRISF